MPGLRALSPALRALRPVRTLEENLGKGRLAHAILLKGEDLSQLEEVAAALAAAVLDIPGKPGSHPDYFTLRPARKSRSIAIGDRDNAEPNTVRHLIRELNQTSNRGGYKVAVIHEADRMNAAAANSFLKTLEEPPAQTLILLLSTRPYDLIETIRSRCFQFRIPARLSRQPDPDWQAWLDDYREWIKRLHRDPDAARAAPDATILQAYGLVSRFTSRIDASADAEWENRDVPDYIGDDELEALRTGRHRGVRDRLLIEVEEATRLAAIELSHELPFPAGQLVRAIAALESTAGLLALNMRDDAAMEAFFLKSLRIWTG